MTLPLVHALRSKLSVWRRGRAFNCENQSSDNWRNRAELAARLLRPHLHPGDVIADFGCGDQKLRHYLDGFAYRGFDLVPRSPEVTPIDLQADAIRGSFDAAALLGVLEYVSEPVAVLRKIRDAAPLLVVSHLFGDNADYFTPELIRRKKWRNVFSRADFEKSVRNAGWRIVESRMTADQLTVLWLLGR